MTSSKHDKGAATERDGQARRKGADRPAADADGGAPAVEEDIGTEGAGTEPPVDDAASGGAAPARRTTPAPRR